MGRKKMRRMMRMKRRRRRRWRENNKKKVRLNKSYNCLIDFHSFLINLD